MIWTGQRECNCWRFLGVWQSPNLPASLSARLPEKRQNHKWIAGQGLQETGRIACYLPDGSDMVVFSAPCEVVRS